MPNGKGMIAVLMVGLIKKPWMKFFKWNVLHEIFLNEIFLNEIF